MRRSVIVLLLLMVSTAALAAAQETPPTPPADEAIPLIVTPPPQMIGGTWRPAVAEPLDGPPEFIETPDDGPATDSCSAATTLLTIPGTDGGQTTVNTFTDVAEDPALSCIYGTPYGPRPAQGYRSAWYKVVAPTTGLLTVEASPNAEHENDYDTIVGIFESSDGTCTVLTEVGCNDDTNGFLSKATAWVIQGRTYYIEIVDWHFGVSGDAILNLTADLPATNLWQQEGTMPLPRSRHATAVVGNDIYVIAGQTDASGNPERTGRTERYNPNTGVWTTLANMPGASAEDPLGYSNTTAAYVNGKIYIPSGYIGAYGSYAGTHWVYDIALNHWDPAPAVPPDIWAEPYGWAAAVTYQTESLNGYYVAGGLTGAPLSAEATPHNDLIFYNANQGFWSLEKTPMTTARYAHVAALVGGQVCVAGGIGAGNILLTGGECYDVSSEVWTPTGTMAVPRYNAASAMGPDDKWYVFGGVDNLGLAIATTEVYDPATNTWTALDHRYDLTAPDRAWARGGFVGDNYYAIGGEVSPGNLVVALVQTLFIPTPDLFFPYVAYDPRSGEPERYTNARALTLNVPQLHDFALPEDVFDVFSFTMPSLDTAVIELSQIPVGSNYDLYVYGPNKALWGSSTNVGALDEALAFNMGPNTYYIVVVREEGPETTARYQIEVSVN